jgi:zinc D-Ala-D-Ala carboxypeptidase
MFKTGRKVAAVALMAATFFGGSFLVPNNAAADCPETGCSSLAIKLINEGRTSFLDFHVSGVVDNATAKKNIYDTSAGRPAYRSSYGTAPGGTVYLRRAMLNGMYNISRAYRTRVTEFAGGSHSSGSHHYYGRAFDIDMINGSGVSSSNPYYANLMQSCRNLGAAEVLGPGNTGHSTHIHCAWTYNY